MNSVVQVVVSALWAVAYVLVDADADYAGRPLLGPGVADANRSVAVVPSLRRVRTWLARRLSSPPATPRAATV